MPKRYELSDADWEIVLIFSPVIGVQGAPELMIA